MAASSGSYITDSLFVLILNAVFIVSARGLVLIILVSINSG